MENNNQTIRFCEALLGLGSHRSRAMANFVMSLASSVQVQTPVELSERLFCHYHYSNLTKVLTHWGISDAEFREFIEPFLPPIRAHESGLRYYALTHDVTKIVKAHSPCLADRQYVPTANNVIAANRALGIGYPVSVLHLGAGEAGWCPPLSMQRVGSAQDTNGVAVQQIMDLVTDKSLPFGQQLVLCRTDSAYGKAIFLSPLYEVDNLVCATRLRAGIKVWTKAVDGESVGGAPRIYGEKYYLTEGSGSKTYRKKEAVFEVWQQALCEQAPDDTVQTSAVMGNGRQVVIHLKRWKDLLLRTKSGASMKNKPLDVVRVLVLDAQTNKPVFDRPLFIGVSGKRKNELTATEVQQQFRERYHVETWYRFAKNRLLLDKRQTPSEEHLDPEYSGLKIVQLATWLMFTARKEIGQVDCPVWQKYLPKNRQVERAQQPVLSIAQVQRASHLLFATFDKTPFLPQKSKKGNGRMLGQKFNPRIKFPVVKKRKKLIRKLKNQQNE